MCVIRDVRCVRDVCVMRDARLRILNAERRMYSHVGTELNTGIETWYRSNPYRTVLLMLYLLWFGPQVPQIVPHC